MSEPMHPEQEVTILGHVALAPDVAATVRFRYLGEKLEVTINDGCRAQGIRVNPSDLLLAVQLIADDVPEAMARVIEAVKAERSRQRKLWVTNKIPFLCNDECVSLGDKLAVIIEGVGEVAKEMNAASGPVPLRTKLIQVAAVAVAWAESLPTE